MAGRLDLTKMMRVDDHYEIPLAGGARAILTLIPELQETAEKVLAQARSPRGAITFSAVSCSSGNIRRSFRIC